MEGVYTLWGGRADCCSCSQSYSDVVSSTCARNCLTRPSIDAGLPAPATRVGWSFVDRDLLRLTEILELDPEALRNGAAVGQNAVISSPKNSSGLGYVNASNLRPGSCVSCPLLHSDWRAARAFRRSMIPTMISLIGAEREAVVEPHWTRVTAGGSRRMSRNTTANGVTGRCGRARWVTAGPERRLATGAVCGPRVASTDYRDRPEGWTPQALPSH
jgi:hypothetical protein